MEQNKTKINFLNEKKWILAWYFKKRKNLQFSEEQFKSQWEVWWKDDIENIDDKDFHDFFKWVRATVSTKTMEQIKESRYRVADTRRVPKGIQQMANDNGYFIKKAAVGKHPLVVSGYQICRSKKDRNPLYGEKYNLTIGQVKRILKSEGKVNRNGIN